MLLSPGGQPVDLALKEMSRDCLSAKMKESLSEMHLLHVLHKDPAPRYWLYNPESKKVVFLILKGPRSLNRDPILGIMSPYRERKRMPRDGIDIKQSSAGIARLEGSNEDPVNVVTIPAITLSNLDYVRNLRINNFIYLRFVAVGFFLF